MMQLDVYREKFRITGWRDGCVWSTESLGCGWFCEDQVKGNIPGDTQVMYVAASDAFARNNMTVRRCRHDRSDTKVR
jgi:hypothetical protein